MNIAVLVGSLQVGGAERVAVVLAREFAARGHVVTLITLDRADRDFYAAPQGVERVALDLHEVSSGRVRSLRATTNRVLAVREATAGARVDVVVSLLDYVNVIALLAGLFRPWRTIVCEHADPEQANWSRLRELARRLTYRRASAIVVLTERASAWATARFPRQRVVVIPNPIDPDAATVPWEAAPRRYIASMGRLIESKGFDDLIKAFAAGAPADFKLVILGDGPEREHLRAVAADAGVADRVQLEGAVPHPAPMLRGAEMFVLASRKEALPNSIIEAMSVGLPVVSYDCPTGPAELIRDGENGFLVPLGDTAAVADAIAVLARDPDLRRRLGAEARRTSAAFDPSRVLLQWERLLDEVGR